MILLCFIACSHHHNKPKHHHHQFNKMCAYEVGENHLDVQGKDEFSLEHEGETYYFSSLENKQKFQKDLNHNVKKSKSNWRARHGQSKDN